MTQPVWRKIVSELPVPEPGQQWAMALEALTSGKLMKIEVVVDETRTPKVIGRWTPKGFQKPCTADGDFGGTLQSDPEATSTSSDAPQPPPALLSSTPSPAGGPSAAPPVTPQGTTTGTQLVSSAPRGALIARIGGSTADQVADAATTPPARVIFSIGRKCVFMVPDKPAGSLFLGVNESAVKNVV